MQIVSIDVWRGKAYLPIHAQFESGSFVDTEPVYVVDLNEEGLISAIEKVLAAGHPRLPDTTPERWQKRKSPVLTATKARSWKELARTGASYGITWTDRHIRVDMSRLSKNSRWEYDPEKVRIFPTNTPLKDIVEVILDDVVSRPELWQQPH